MAEYVDIALTRFAYAYALQVIILGGSGIVSRHIAYARHDGYGSLGGF